MGEDMDQALIVFGAAQQVAFERLHWQPGSKAYRALQRTEVLLQRRELILKGQPESEADLLLATVGLSR